jgi:pimeloyl-ACP methyl ester carboxylesterase
VIGEGPAVLLLHAGVADRRMWEPQWRPLAEGGYRVIRPDLRGYGDTPPASAAYHDAEDVGRLLDTLGVDRVTVIAASFGGSVALDLAARRPDRVNALLLLATDRDGIEPGSELRAFAEQENALLEAGDLTAATELNVGTWLGPEADDNARALVRDMQRRAFELDLTAEVFDRADAPHTDLSAITARTLVVSGRHDLPDFRAIAAGLPALLTGTTRAAHRELPWAGHLPSLERPAETTALMLDFLAEGR